MSSLYKTAILIIPAMLCGAILSAGVVQSADDTVRDPMQPPAFALKQFRLAKIKRQGAGSVKKAAVKKAPAKPLNLSTILIGQARKVAIINDRMLVVGDKIDDAKVVKILNDRVELIRKGKRIKLVLDNQVLSIRKNAVKSNL